jgi:bifunctional non-homologous end joining protein LigD
MDGELVCMDGGKPNLSLVQRRVHLQDRHRVEFLSRRSPVTYIVFDLLYLRRRSVMPDTLTNRRSVLSEIMCALRLPGVKIIDSVTGRGCDLFRAVTQLGLEGVMAKRAESTYRPGKRSRAWLKIKPATVQGDGG